VAAGAVPEGAAAAAARPVAAVPVALVARKGAAVVAVAAGAVLEDGQRVALELDLVAARDELFFRLVFLFWFGLVLVVCRLG